MPGSSLIGVTDPFIKSSVLVLYSYLTLTLYQSCQVWLGATGVPQLMTSFTSAGALYSLYTSFPITKTYSALPCLRVAALYDHAKWVQGVLWASFFLTYGVVLTLLGLSYTTVWKTITESPVTHMCLPANVPFQAYAIYLAPMTLDVLVIVLTVIKACENSADLRSSSGTPIVCRVAQIDSHSTFLTSYTSSSL